MTTPKNPRAKQGARGNNLPKMETVAEVAGVSMMTVSRVLNGKANVHPNTRKKVEDTIREIGYTPNISARSLASAEAPFVGLAYLNPSGGYLGEFLLGALSSARRTGLHVIVESCSIDPKDWADEVLVFARQPQMRGLILPPPFCEDPRVLEAARDLDIPCVRVSNSQYIPGYPSIRIDEYQAAFEMTQHLIKHGHQHIGFVKGPENQEAARQRHAGFVDAMHESGLGIQEAWVGSGDYAAGPALEFAKKILSRKNRPTAIFASNDDMAIGVYTAAHHAGLRIPDDISIVGFDNQPIAAALWPGLTTVHQPISEMAEKAVAIVANHSRSNPRGQSAGRDIILPYQVVTRGSLTSPPKT